MDLNTFILICTIINLVCLGISQANGRRMRRMKDQIAILNTGIKADLNSMEDILEMMKKRPPRMLTTEERNKIIDEEE